MARTALLALSLASACNTTRQDLGRDLSSITALIATRVVAAHQHTCAIDEAGRLFCWGLGHDGRLGIDPRDATSECGGLECEGSPRPVPTLSGVRDVVLGEIHTCALLEDGRLRCFGADWLGQLARGTSDGEPHPTPVTVELDMIQDVAAGEFHTCVTRYDGSVWCWGVGQRGQLGVDPSTLETCIAGGPVFYQLSVPIDTEVPCATRPVRVPGIDDAEEITAGAFHTCVTRASGGVSCWGAGDRGQLGNGALAEMQITPVDVVGVTDADHVSAGYTHTCAKTADSGLTCWGSHSRGQLGIGTDGWTYCGPDNHPCSPMPIDIALGNVAEVSAGTEHTCAITHAGEVHCFGDASEGRLGLGEISGECDGPWGGTMRACRTAPTLVTSGVIDVTSGYEHTCVIREGRVECTGTNEVGQAGAPPGGVSLELIEVTDPIEYR